MCVICYKQQEHQQILVFDVYVILNFDLKCNLINILPAVRLITTYIF